MGGKTCRNGHEMTLENLYVVPKTGERVCRACKRERNRRSAPVVMEPTVKEKACSRCGEVKPASEFTRDSSRKTGLCDRCKVCRKDWWDERAESGADPYPRHRSPEKMRARNLVKKAIQRGKIGRPDRCEDCRGAPDPGVLLHAHHEDYSRPLDVQWLCPTCHGGRHRADRATPSRRGATGRGKGG